MPAAQLKDLPLFGGITFEKKRDGQRLNAQLLRVRNLMIDSTWRTLEEISIATGFPEASISARLRDLRKEKFGGYTVERKFYKDGQFIYRVTQ